MHEKVLNINKQYNDKIRNQNTEKKENQLC